MVYNVLLVLLALVSVAMVGSILMQRSEGGALGMGGGGPSSMLSGRGAANLMSRVTTGLGIAFFVLALGLSLAGGHRSKTGSVIDATTAPTTTPNGLPKSIDLGPSIPASATPAASGAAPAAPSIPSSLPSSSPVLSAPAASAVEPAKK